jgi:hypothetical protein
MQAEVPAGEPPLHRPAERGAPAPAVGSAAAPAVARIVDALQEAASHVSASLRLGVVLAVGGAPEDPAEDADDAEGHDGGGEDDQVQHRRRPGGGEHDHDRSVRRKGEGAQAAGRAPSEGVGGYGEHLIALEAAAPHAHDPNSR